MSKVVTVTDADLSKAFSHDIPVVLYYWAEWCGPCKKQAPIMDALSEDHKGKVIFAKINADENPKTATANNVSGLPTIHIYQNGEIVKAFTGAQSNAKLSKALSEILDTQ